MEWTNIAVFLGCMVFIFVLGKFFIWPIKKILKVLVNSAIGGVIICAINFVGNFFNFHIGLNLITSILVGFLGIPGAVLLIIIKILVG